MERRQTDAYQKAVTALTTSELETLILRLIFRRFLQTDLYTKQHILLALLNRQGAAVIPPATVANWLVPEMIIDPVAITNLFVAESDATGAPQSPPRPQRFPTPPPRPAASVTPPAAVMQTQSAMAFSIPYPMASRTPTPPAVLIAPLPPIISTMPPPPPPPPLRITPPPPITSPVHD